MTDAGVVGGGSLGWKGSAGPPGGAVGNLSSDPVAHRGVIREAHSPAAASLVSSLLFPPPCLLVGCCGLRVFALAVPHPLPGPPFPWIFACWLLWSPRLNSSVTSWSLPLATLPTCHSVPHCPASFIHMVSSLLVFLTLCLPPWHVRPRVGELGPRLPSVSGRDSRRKEWVCPLHTRYFFSGHCWAQWEPRRQESQPCQKAEGFVWENEKRNIFKLHKHVMNANKVFSK